MRLSLDHDYEKPMEVPSAGGETVLIVDDDELVLRAVVGMVENLGYRVLSANGGPAALDMLRKDVPIDLLFTDVMMPGGLHGPQLVDEARRLRPEIRVLYTSGFLEYSVLRDGLDPHIEQLRKPYQRHDLAIKLRMALDSRPVAHSQYQSPQRRGANVPTTPGAVLGFDPDR